MEKFGFRRGVWVGFNCLSKAFWYTLYTILSKDKIKVCTTYFVAMTGFPSCAVFIVLQKCQVENANGI